MGTVNRFILARALPLTLIAASCAAWVVLGDKTPQAAIAPPRDAVFFLSPIEENASETIPDWATGADLVAEVAVVGERAVEPATSETAGHDGFELVGRSVTLTVKSVIWRSPTASEPNPTTFTMNAFGWMREDGGSQREVAVEGAARLEPGHEYVIALKWRGAECAPGDETVPARWSALGTAAVLPADDNTIGIGELEGSDVDLVDDAASTDAPVQPDSALSEFTGEQPEAVETALDEAVEDVRDIADDPTSAC